jgi:3,4-dihydroxy-2-butanone 4-phosphate synthase
MEVPAGGRLRRAASRTPSHATTTEKVAFVIRHTSGIVCVAMPASQLDELDLPLMVVGAPNARPAFTVTVDAASAWGGR